MSRRSIEGSLTLMQESLTGGLLDVGLVYIGLAV
jgi:hypothetical protein